MNRLFDSLLWHQHGGSGYTLTRADLLDMDVDELLWFSARCGEHRRQEAEALKRANRGR